MKEAEALQLTGPLGEAVIQKTRQPELQLLKTHFTWDVRVCDASRRRNGIKPGSSLLCPGVTFHSCVLILGKRDVGPS